MLTPYFKSRAFADRPQPWHAFKVESCSWAAMGGPKRARLVATITQPLDVGELTGLLRAPVELSDNGRRAWWGYVHAAMVQDNLTGLWYSLNDLANRVRVSYAEINDDMRGGGKQTYTSWADDLQSQAIYGIKEQQATLLNANSTQATTYRDVILSNSKQPAGRIVIGQPAGITVVLDCRGWWDTLDWRIYTQDAGLVGNIVNAAPMPQNVGTPAEQYLSQQFQVTQGGWRIETVWVQVRQVGTCWDALGLNLEADGGTTPGGWVTSADTVMGLSISTTGFAWTKFTFSTPYTLASNTKYWLTFYRSGAFDAANYYRLQMDETLSYASGILKYYNGAGWVSRSPDADLIFRTSGRMPNDTQITLMAAASGAGQFLAGVRFDQATGLYSNPYRQGSKTALAELQALLASGSTAGELLATVTPERYLVVKLKPSREAAISYQITADGIIRLPSGMPAPPTAELAGKWAALNTAWSSTIASGGLPPGLVYLAEVEWQAGAVRACHSQG